MSTKPTPSLAEQERMLEKTRAELRAEQIFQMSPDLPGLAAGYSEPERDVAAGGSEAAAACVGLLQATRLPIEPCP
jgi:hypothetical protein